MRRIAPIVVRWRIPIADFEAERGGEFLELDREPARLGMPSVGKSRRHIRARDRKTARCIPSGVTARTRSIGAPASAKTQPSIRTTSPVGFRRVRREPRIDFPLRSSWPMETDCPTSRRPRQRCRAGGHGEERREVRSHATHAVGRIFVLVNVLSLAQPPTLSIGVIIT